MNIKLKLILGFLGISIMIILWNILAVGELQKLPSDYQLIIEHVGEDRVVDEWGGALSEKIPIKEVSKQKTVNVDDNTLEIDSSLIAIDVRNGDVIFDSFMTFYVDQTTKEHISGVDGFFEFPPQVTKQTYEFFSPINHAQLTFTFENENTILGLDVYDFSCGALGIDDSTAWDEFAPNQVFLDITCKVSVEPITGLIVNYEDTWHDYGIIDGEKVDVEIGYKQASDFSISVLVESARNQIELYFLYTTIIPLLLGAVSSAILLGIITLQEKFKSDILSQQKTAKLEKAIEQEKLKKERLTAIGELSASISHDIRNPLSAIKTSNRLIKKRVHDEKGLNEIKRIDRSVARIDHQIIQVLDFVKATPLNLEKFSITHVLKRIIKTMEITPNISINMPQDDFEIWFDRSKIENVFYNIIFNAIQAIENQRGTITIRTSEEGDMIKMDFENDGPNIPDEVLPKIFEPLFSTKQKGTGLGLSGAKNSVEQHGGTISVTNNPVVFTIKLPKKGIVQMDERSVDK